MTPNPATGAAAPSTITIDVTKDLSKKSDLGSFFIGQAPAVFSIGAEIAKYADQPGQDAINAKPTAIKFSGEPQWKLPSGIGFSLNTDVNCQISIGSGSEKFTCKKAVDANDTMDIVAGPTSGMVYVNIDLDFDIKGNLSGSGTLGGLGIGGKASGSKNATFSYCHPVSATTITREAVKEAFEALVFPLKPSCALSMVTGSIGRVNFDGAMNVELDLTYGFGNHKLSAQNVGLTKSSVEVAGTKLAAPSAEVDTGAKGSFVYQHSDNFCAIVHKVDAKSVRLFLVHSASNETTESAGVTVGIKLNSSSAKVDTAKLAGGIRQVTKSNSPTLAGEMASYGSQIESSLVSKGNKWLSDNNVGLSASLAQEKDRAVLYVFNVDLSSAAAQQLATRSWTSFVNGDLQAALKTAGFTLVPGSGISEHLKSSSTIQLHFFNLQLAETTDYFKNSVTKLGPDGSIRFFADVGEESKFSTQHQSTTATIHFVATASATTSTGNFQNVEVDFCIELSETDNPGEAAKIANCVGALGISNQKVKDAEQQMLHFVDGNKSKTLTLAAALKPSAYGKLSCTPYTVGADHKLHPPALPPQQDEKNWNAFQSMVQSLMPDLGPVAGSLQYRHWQIWNLKQNDDPTANLQPDADHVPDRRMQGAYESAAINMFGQNDWLIPNNFLLGSTEFMNLCDNLHTLSATLAAIKTDSEWDSVINTLIKWVKAEGNPDWSKASLGALLYLGSLQTYVVAFDFQPAKDNSNFTCTLTLS